MNICMTGVTELIRAISCGIGSSPGSNLQVSSVAWPGERSANCQLWETIPNARPAGAGNPTAGSAPQSSTYSFGAMAGAPPIGSVPQSIVSALALGHIGKRLMRTAPYPGYRRYGFTLTDPSAFFGIPPPAGEVLSWHISGQSNLSSRHPAS